MKTEKQKIRGNLVSWPKDRLKKKKPNGPAGTSSVLSVEKKGEEAKWEERGKRETSRPLKSCWLKDTKNMSRGPKLKKRIM